MFYLAGVGLAFFLTVLLLSKSRKTLADKILAGWLLFLTLHLLLFYFQKAGLYPQLLAADFPLPLVHGPFLFLYTRALTRGRLSQASLLHFIPALAVMLYLIQFYSLPFEQKIYVFQHEGAGYETFNLIRTLTNTTSGILYIILATIALHRHRLTIVQEFSSTEKINLQWLQYLIVWLTTIWLLVIFTTDDLVFVATVLFVLFIGFFGIRQVGIFNTREPVALPGIIDESDISEKRKYQKSGLTTDAAETLHHQLSTLMQDEKRFRQSELSLSELAAQLNTQPNYLSQVINEREGKTFYDYINTLRIEEFKRLAAGPDSRKYTLLGLAQECGFNSKSSFNRYFKKVTGQSPSEFLQSGSEVSD